MPHKRISGIYIITCKVNNKHYIGESNSCLRRLCQHKLSLRKNIHHSFHLQRAYNKYGLQNFEFDILETYPENLLKFMEKYWIELLYSSNRKYGYNILTPEGDGGFETTKELKENLRKHRLGKKMSDKSKKKLREINKGKILSKEDLFTLQEGGRRYRKTEKFKEDTLRWISLNGRPVIIYNYKTELWKRFDTALSASKEMNSARSALFRAIDHPSRTVKGYLIFSEKNFNSNIKYVKQKRINGKREKYKSELE